MKIAHITAFYTPAIGGVKQVVEELAKRQVKAGHEVHVYCSDWDKTKRIKIENEIIDGVHVHRCKHIIRVANFETIWFSVYSKLMKEDYDIIHSHVYGHLYFFLAGLVARRKKIPHVHTTHCPWTEDNRSRLTKVALWISYNIFCRRIMKRLDKIIAITPWEKGFIKKYGGRDEQIEFIPNGMDKVFFNKIEDNDFKEKNNIQDKLVLFFGRLNVTKAPDEFVRIAKEILKTRKNITFVIRGSDEGMKEEVKKLIAKEKRIILLDECRDRNEIIEMYQAADIFVLPSFREGLPLTLFEAMASGLPIVATPVNGIPYEMKDKENGFLVKYGDTKEFAKKILYLLDNDKKRKSIIKNNLKKAKNYTWDIISDKTLEVYNEVRRK